MRKIIAASLACALCYGAAFGFDLMGFVKDTIGIESGVTAGFSRDNRREVVKDDIYKLMWQDGEDIYQGTYDEAVKYCENLNFAGYDDWRLPTINELLSITDDSRYNPAINKAFKNVAYETNDKGEKSYSWYWSSTKSASVSSGAWIVYFRGGNDNWGGVSSRSFVRCVRDY
ncbi:DUF1566 domain-containing protein [Campylobacter concisus]|uniref:Lcl C-terminal domain-containing protein n=1 Tax=Campylobacter concisus TaxID=199 RepID=UPI0011E89275|nr:DUF1566 domain-containing protein [Campylobacter concisus]